MAALFGAGKLLQSSKAKPASQSRIEPTPAQQRAQERVEKRDAELDERIESRKAATGRRRRGRASLIYDDERGVSKTLG